MKRISLFQLQIGLTVINVLYGSVKYRIEYFVYFIQSDFLFDIIF